MEIVFFILLLLLLGMFGYARLQKNVIKMPGELNASEDDEVNIHHRS